jgi:capsular exopolysaccharide synthesis family protein
VAHDTETPKDGDLQRYLRTLLERRWAMVFAFAVGAVSYVWWAVHQVRLYQSTATVIVESQPPQVFGAEVRDVVQIGPGQGYYMQDYIQTQRRVLTSDSLVRRVIDRLNLQDDREFWGGVPPQPIERQVYTFASTLTADALLDTQIIAVKFVHRDPRQAKRAVDAVVDEYIESNLQLRDVSNTNASRFLAGEADQLRHGVAAAEMALFEFKRKNDLLSVGIEDRVNNVTRTIDKLTDALTDARLRKGQRQTEADGLAKLLDVDPVGLTSGSGSDALGTLKRDVVDEERKLSELKARYHEEHPLVKQQAAKVTSVQAALHHEIALQLRGAGALADQAADQEHKIAAQLDLAKQEGARVTRLEIEYAKLKREADALSKQYQLVQNRDKETELASQVKVNNLRVMDYARIPTIPVSPHLQRAAVTTLLLSLICGMVLAFLLDALDRSIKTRVDVETKLGMPFLGMLPRLANLKSDMVVAEEPTSQMAEQARLIRTNLMFAGINRQLKRLLFTSALPREGKTLSSVSIASALAQAGQRVLIVDADLRRPRLHSALKLDGTVGVTNVLLGSVPLDKAIVPTIVPNLSALFCGPVPPSPAELVEGNQFRELLEQCSEKFDRVIIDSPPAIPVSDPAILSGLCDGVVLVVRSGKTPHEQAARAARTLSNMSARILGVVLNDVDAVAGGYGYGYGYGYGAKKYGRSRRERKRA